jgi:hypothetical protein
MVKLSFPVRGHSLLCKANATLQIAVGLIVTRIGGRIRLPTEFGRSDVWPLDLPDQGALVLLYGFFAAYCLIIAAN